MIVTRGFNSSNLVTRGYGVYIFAVFVEGICIFYKGLIQKLFNKDDIQRIMNREEQIVFFEKEIESDKYYKEGQKVLFSLIKRILTFTKSKPCK